MNTGIHTSIFSVSGPTPVVLPGTARPYLRGGHTGLAAVAGFTLVEMLIVITVITILVALMFTVIRSTTRSSYIAATRQTVEMIQTAMDVYVTEHQVLPPTAPGNVLASSVGSSLAPQTLDLLVPDGFQLHTDHLSQTASPRFLIDDWQRQISYTADHLVGAALSLNRPIPPALWPSDWNPQQKLPFAYIWSLGPPTSYGDAYDAKATSNATNWIHPTLSP